MPRRSYRDGAFAPPPPAPAADIVIPVVPAPDDPGPEPEPDPEPARDVPVSGWRALFPGWNLAISGLARYQEREIRRNSSVGRAHHS